MSRLWRDPRLLTGQVLLIGRYVMFFFQLSGWQFERIPQLARHYSDAYSERREALRAVPSSPSKRPSVFAWRYCARALEYDIGLKMGQEKSARRYQTEGDRAAQRIWILARKKYSSFELTAYSISLPGPITTAGATVAG